MSSSNWSQVKALFSAALEMPEEDRRAFLKAEANGDAALIAEVQSLLDSHELPGEFLETVTHDFRAQAFAATGAARNRIGERIGAYRIVGVLGTGGMGDVFKAVRDDDHYQAEVAIKLMRADVRSIPTEHRFRVERQILAGLDHRNIARLLDGGTADGMPYLVMELVAGDPIDGYCDERKLDVRDRVQLFLQVCAAVSYAHQHLIVHRDLKPSNILVTPDGSVKLLDFGIAKLLEADAPTVAAGAGTVTTLRAMTLEFASPEQVSGGAVTTVSDVYSLGVVLYRLLTGKSPYSVRTSDAERMAEILSDTTPTRPSQLERKVDGDLDNVLLMALRKEPQRRYGSVEQFANDLRNYLAGMPVKARGNSLRYRAGKFVRRRKVEIAAGTLAVGTLLGAVVFSTREARIAEHERQVAQQHFDSVRTLANTLLFDVHDEMVKVSGSIKAREKLVGTSLEYLDALYQESGSDARLQEELARAYMKVAAIQGNDGGASRGNFKGAIESYQRAIALLTPLVAAAPANTRAGWTLGKAYTELAGLVMVARSPKDSLEFAQQGVSLTEKYAPAIPDEAERMDQLGNAYVASATILGFMGRPLDALAATDEQIAMIEAYQRAHPDDERAYGALYLAYNRASMLDDPRLSESANIDRALGLLRKALVAAGKLLEFKPGDSAYLMRQASSRHNMANNLYARGEYGESLALYQLAAPVAVRAAQDSDDSHAQFAMGLFESRVARGLFKAGRIDEARALFEKCERVLDGVLERDGSLRTEYAVGQTAVRFGELYVYLAETARGGEAQRALWLTARAKLRRGVASLNKVTASAKLQAIDQKVVDDGAAALARVEAAIATN